MTYTLTGTRYIGTGTEPVPVAGYDLVNTVTGDFKASNSTGTAWVLCGNVDNQYLGHLPLGGGVMAGAITGASGWATLDSPNFTTSAKLNGVDLATTADLATTSTNIINSINPEINKAIASTSVSASLKSNMKIETGFLQFGATTTVHAPQAIPLPTYNDGTIALEEDCKWICGLIGGTLMDSTGVIILDPATGLATTERPFAPCGGTSSAFDTYIRLNNTALTTRTITLKNVQADGITACGCLVWYMIIAVR